MYFSTVFLDVLLNCISQLYFSTVKWCVQQEKADHVCNRPTRRDPPITSYLTTCFSIFIVLFTQMLNPLWIVWLWGKILHHSCIASCWAEMSFSDFCTLPPQVDAFADWRPSASPQYNPKRPLDISLRSKGLIPSSQRELRIRGWVIENQKVSWCVAKKGQCWRCNLHIILERPIPAAARPPVRHKKRHISRGTKCGIIDQLVSKQSKNSE